MHKCNVRVQHRCTLILVSLFLSHSSFHPNEIFTRCDIENLNQHLLVSVKKKHIHMHCLYVVGVFVGGDRC